MKDVHIHSKISHDGKSTVEEYIAAAREKGMDELTFTEHWDDYEGIVTELRSLDIASYYQRFLAEKGKTDFPINFGVEIGLQSHKPIAEATKARVKSFVETYPFDFIIGSSHITKGLDMAYDPNFFTGLSRREAYMQYFEETLENINRFDEFDVYGHLDYVARYGGFAEKTIRYAEFAEILDEIFKALIRKDKGLELNTSGFRYGLGVPHPNREVLARYRELGGKILTLGSDAHRAEDLGSHFEEALDLIESVGFTELAVYRCRVPEFMKIEDFRK